LNSSITEESYSTVMLQLLIGLYPLGEMLKLTKRLENLLFKSKGPLHIKLWFALDGNQLFIMMHLKIILQRIIKKCGLTSRKSTPIKESIMSSGSWIMLIIYVWALILIAIVMLYGLEMIE
jgi:hypothetical protein